MDLSLLWITAGQDTEPDHVPVSLCSACLCLLFVLHLGDCSLLPSYVSVSPLEMNLTLGVSLTE